MFSTAHYDYRLHLAVEAFVASFSAWSYDPCNTAAKNQALANYDEVKRRNRFNYVPKMRVLTLARGHSGDDDDDYDVLRMSHVVHRDNIKAWIEDKYRRLVNSAGAAAPATPETRNRNRDSEVYLITMDRGWLRGAGMRYYYFSFPHEDTAQMSRLIARHAGPLRRLWFLVRLESFGVKVEKVKAEAKTEGAAGGAAAAAINNAESDDRVVVQQRTLTNDESGVNKETPEEAKNAKTEAAPGSALPSAPVEEAAEAKDTTGEEVKTELEDKPDAEKEKKE